MVNIGPQAGAAAFGLRPDSARAVSAAQIAAELNAAPSAVEGELRRLDVAGQIRLSAEGHVIGSAGLGVGPGAHELWVRSPRILGLCADDGGGDTRALQACARGQVPMPTP